VKFAGMVKERLLNVAIPPTAFTVNSRRFLLPDGSERYLVDEALLTQAANDLAAE
jgi:hypothetical protein